MKSIKELRNRKGVSPVIATVILVAVAITVAVAVAYWMSGIAGQYTSFEKIELPAHYSQWTDDLDGLAGLDPGWKEYIELKNSGSKDSTITNIFLNNIPIKDYMYGALYNITLYVGDEVLVAGVNPLDLATDIAIQIGNGESEKIILWIIEGTEGCSSGTTIDLKIVTAAGNQYPMLEVLA